MICRYVFRELSKYTGMAKPIYVNCWKKYNRTFYTLRARSLAQAVRPQEGVR
ncbi:MAG: hypothetical protein DRJ59_00830 [Thermoprotei archaeon]|nr:MAG: hypothetical protein DRJ59_00830 [Thermoprotei archaeon]